VYQFRFYLSSTLPLSLIGKAVLSTL